MRGKKTATFPYKNVYFLYTGYFERSINQQFYRFRGFKYLLFVVFNICKYDAVRLH